MTAVSTRSFYIEQVQNVTVVCFTVSTILEQNYEFVSDELFEIVEYLMSTDPIQVVLDMGNIRQIDDWGLAMLRAFHETIESHSGNAVFCRLKQRVSSFLGDTGFIKGFSICDTRGEAIRFFENR